jgi:hypothetical protein
VFIVLGIYNFALQLTNIEPCAYECMPQFRSQELTYISAYLVSTRSQIKTQISVKYICKVEVGTIICITVTRL